jgi:hypothetical protein
MTEADLQKDCVEWLRLQHKNVLFYSVPNEARRSYKLANYLKLMGLKSGVPDICICKAMHGYHGMYIELKVGRNKLTENQKDLLSKLSDEGYLAVEVRDSFEEFKDVVGRYLREDKV